MCAGPMIKGAVHPEAARGIANPSTEEDRPWALAYPTGDPRTDAFLNQALVGMTLGITAVAFQAAEGAVRRMPAVTVLAGAWLVVVPHLQGFRDSATANCTVAGSVTVALGVLMCLAGPRPRRG